MNKKQMIRIARLTLAVAAVLTMTGHAAARSRPNKIIVVRPTELPELARVPGQAMVLHKTGYGTTLLYVEQNDGARLVLFDVTDPANVKQESAARLDAPGSFDFVSSLGDHAELIRFRDGQGEAVLDLRNVGLPTIEMIPGLSFQGSTEHLGNDGFMISNQASVPSNSKAVDYQVEENRFHGSHGRRRSPCVARYCSRLKIFEGPGVCLEQETNGQNRTIQKEKYLEQETKDANRSINPRGCRRPHNDRLCRSEERL